MSTSLLQGAHASATVADTREANKVIRLCRQHAHFPIRFSPITSDDLTLVIVAGVCREMDTGWIRGDYHGETQAYRARRKISELILPTRKIEFGSCK